MNRPRRWAWVGGLLLAALVLACAPAAVRPAATSVEDEVEDETEDLQGPPPGSAPTITPRPLPTSAVVGWRSELIAEGLTFPQSLAFTPDGRLFFVEVKKGLVRVINGRTLQEPPVLAIEVPHTAEQGLISVVPDPGFAQNHYLYTFYTEVLKGSDVGRPRRNRLTRWVEQGGSASAETPVLDNLPYGKCCHTGGKLAFAPDGSVFLTIGDQGDASRREAQNPKVVNGKLLRFDPNTRAKDPDALAALTFASGLRNPYGLAVHPANGLPFITDNGPDFCDEVNLARRGANFGNPEVECAVNDPRFDDPVLDSGVDRLAYTGIQVYRGSMFPEFNNNLLFCAFNNGSLIHGVLEPPAYERVTRVEQVLGGQDGEGCRLDLAVAADGSIYYSSASKIFRLSR